MAARIILDPLIEGTVQVDRYFRVVNFVAGDMWLEDVGVDQEKVEAFKLFLATGRVRTPSEEPKPRKGVRECRITTSSAILRGQVVQE
jgi:hypothetical protein